jgi:pimeloyl-ACP methyl ester carboxylesterase
VPERHIQDTLVYFQQRGQGPPLLLLHCGLGTGGDFAGLAPELAQRYTTLTPDRPGYGRSDHDAVFDAALFRSQADLMAGLLQETATSPAFVWGWSDGGVVALWLAIRHPGRVHGLVVEAGHIRGDKPDSSLVAQYLHPEKLPPEEQARLARQHGDPYWRSLSRRWARLWLDLGMRAERLYAGRLGEVSAPTLILHAEDDPYVPAAEGRALHEAIPHSQLCILPAGGHFLHTGAAQAEILSRVLAFFEAVPAPTGASVGGTGP